jgi:hypothetical protein
LKNSFTKNDDKEYRSKQCIDEITGDMPWKSKNLESVKLKVQLSNEISAYWQFHKKDEYSEWRFFTLIRLKKYSFLDDI